MFCKKISKIIHTRTINHGKVFISEADTVTTKEDGMEKQMANEIWGKMNTDRKCPDVEFKQGGYSACYYPSRHLVKLRSNVWSKPPSEAERR